MFVVVAVECSSYGGALIEARARADGTMAPELRDEIEKSPAAIGQVEYQKRSHTKSGPVSRCFPPEDLVHEQTETLRKGTGKRVSCSHPKCEAPYAATISTVKIHMLVFSWFCVSSPDACELTKLTKLTKQDVDRS